MDSWWQLGEWAGFSGSELSIYRITCPFCMEKGNFEVAFHAEKSKPNSRKTLNFDTLKCVNCSGYVLCLWSKSSNSFDHNGIHSYKVLPWPLKYEGHPEYWPEAVGRYWLQAKKSLLDENWDATAVMARSALQISLRDQGAEGRNLKQEIDNLAEKGILPPIIKEWSNNIREIGNDSAHPRPDQPPTNPQDARDIVRFLDFLLDYLYNLPHQIEKYRERREENNS